MSVPVIALLVTAPARPLEGAVALYPLGDHACAILEDGEHRCWRGAGPAVPRPEPLPGPAVAWPTPIDLYQPVGPDSACVLSAGRVFCAGRSWRRRFGMPPGTPTDEPVEVPELRNTSAIAGPCALLRDRVRCVGPSGPSTLPLPPIRLLLPPRCALDHDGALHCWERGAIRSRIDGLIDASLPMADGRRGLVRRHDGTVWQWTDGPDSWEQVPVPPLPHVDGRSLLLRDDRACALIPRGRVMCWGDAAGFRVDEGPGGPVYLTPPTPPPTAALPCTLVEGAVRCTADPWESPSRAPVEQPTDALLVYGTHGCAVHGDTVRCLGVLHGAEAWLLDPERTVLHGVRDLYVGERIGAITSDGLYELEGGGWQRLAPALPPGSRLRGQADLLCVASPERPMTCYTASGPTQVAIPLDDALCTADGRCLRATPTTKDLARPYPVEDG